MAQLKREFIPELQRDLYYPNGFIVKKIVPRKTGGIETKEWHAPWTSEKYEQILKFAGNDGYATLIVRLLTKNPGADAVAYLRQLKAEVDYGVL